MEYDADSCLVKKTFQGDILAQYFWHSLPSWYFLAPYNMNAVGRQGDDIIYILCFENDCYVFCRIQHINISFYYQHISRSQATTDLPAHCSELALHIVLSSAFPQLLYYSPVLFSALQQYSTCWLVPCSLHMIIKWNTQYSSEFLAKLSFFWLSTHLWQL
jgi:hypothetical protein